MDLELPADVEEFRGEVRRVLAEELPADWSGIGAIPDQEATRAFDEALSEADHDRLDLARRVGDRVRHVRDDPHRGRVQQA